MQTGAITSHIDVAQLVLYAFWIFLFGLIVYVRKEDKREGYPLESPSNPRNLREGFPAMPKPKTFLLHNGEKVSKPDYSTERRSIALKPSAPFSGSPYDPTGNPLEDGVGPASYSARMDVPDHSLDGGPKIVPLRVAPDFGVADFGPDPRGWDVVGCDGFVGGTVSEVWIDRSEPQVRYFEVAVKDAARTALLPITVCRFNDLRRAVLVNSICGDEFAGVPGIANPDQVTLLEEDKICAYYAGGNLYSLPDRMGPLL
jgi:photosynthetic reaction center H subunit